MKNSKQAGTSLLRNKVYVRMYTAFATATFGDWFDALAIQVMVGYRWQASPLMLALIPISMALPGIILGSIAGVAADRLNKLQLMRLCDLLTALLTLVVLLAPSMVWLLPVLMLRAAVSTLNVPAQQSMTRSIVREDQLLQATSLNGLVNQGSKIAGPLLGGLALSLLSPHWCIVLNAGLRLCSFLLLLTINKEAGARQAGGVERGEAAGFAAAGTLETAIPDTAGGEAQEPRVPLRTLWREGWSFLLSSRLLLSTMLFGLTGALAIQMIDFQFTSLFRDIAPAEEAMLGWMVAASGAGAILMIMLMGKLNQGTGYGWKLGTGYALIGAAVVGLGLLQPGVSVLPVLLLGFVLGAGNGIFLITFNYCLQKETPPSMTGRIFGIQNTVLSTVMIVAPLLGGLLVEFAGPGVIFVSFGAVIALLGLLGIGLGRVLWPVARELGAEAQVAEHSARVNDSRVKVGSGAGDPQ
ncbi:MFS transporter [Paenibacillus donghaensis]|uniref:MFS transporter n=1 Tax=Paenibacillus donghaensis TaxID=414771 RepID=A0A2Z2K2V2_9BACL|nr:MFS transporter [Paenibacillus donghaensis]ASA19436.1 MFS transporter [Paenibacillus donghaensis]